MRYLDSSQPDLQSSLTTWLIGFFGAIVGFLILPKTLKFLIRRFIFGVFSEVLAVVVAGLLAEKAVERLTDKDDPF